MHSNSGRHHRINISESDRLWKNVMTDYKVDVTCQIGGVQSDRYQNRHESDRLWRNVMAGYKVDVTCQIVGQIQNYEKYKSMC